MSLKEISSEKHKGAIPETWLLDRLDKFWSVTDCKHVTADFVDSGFPLASIKEVQSKYVQLANAKQTTKHFYDLLIEGGRRPVPGDLIISRNATVGAVAQVTEWHPKFAMGQDVCLLRRRCDEYSSDYLQAVLQSSIVEKQLSDMMVGSTFKRINVQQIKNFVVPVPSPEEQKAIATTLSDVDALIAGLEKLIAKKRDIKQAAMQQLLTGQTRLPGFSGEWEVKCFGEFGSIYGGLIGKRKDDFWNGDAYYVPFVNVMANVVMDSSAFEKVYVGDSEHQNKVRLGDLLINGSSETPEDLALFSFVPEAIDNLYLNSFCFGFRLNSNIAVDGLFLSYYMRSSIGRNLIKALAQGSTRYNLSKNSFLNAELAFPVLKEQTAIAEVFSAIDEEIKILNYRVAKICDIKTGIVQELLTGRTRLI